MFRRYGSACSGGDRNRVTPPRPIPTAATISRGCRSSRLNAPCPGQAAGRFKRSIARADRHSRRTFTAFVGDDRGEFTVGGALTLPIAVLLRGQPADRLASHLGGTPTSAPARRHGPVLDQAVDDLLRRDDHGWCGHSKALMSNTRSNIALTESGRHAGRGTCQECRGTRLG